MKPAFIATLVAGVIPISLAAASFTNTSSVSTPNGNDPMSTVGKASPYPSSIAVSGLTGNLTHITVSLHNVTHPRPDDYQVLLVGPGGSPKFIVLCDAGGTSTPLSGQNTITFDDTAAASVPDSGPLTAGSWRPTCVDFQNNINNEFPTVAGPFALPAPRGNATLDGTFNGLNPNGTWSLYIVDDVGSVDNAQIQGGWSLNIETSSVAVPTVTTVSSSQNPSLTGASVTFSSLTTSSGSPVTSGSITFQDGNVILASNVAVNGSGVATFSTSGLTEGSHVITASYSPGPDLLLSSGTVTQTVTTATQVNENEFCNPGGITLLTSAPFTGNVYPSQIQVSGISGQISRLRAKLTGISIDRPDDLEVLLVAPEGQSMIILGDSGGTAAVSGVNLTLDDSAASLVPDSGPFASGTYRPTSVNSSITSLPAPAPVGPYPHPAPFGSSTFANIFNGANPNGTWKLFIVDDVTGGGGSIASWCLIIETTPTIICPPNITTNVVSGTCDSPLVSFTVTAGGFPTPSVVCKIGDTVITSPHVFPKGTNVVTCTAGTATCSFTVTVLDNEAPTITCPADLVQHVGPTAAGSNVSFSIPVGSDNCPGPLLSTCTPTPGSFFPIGTTAVSCTATDASGNTASCTFNILVNRRPLVVGEALEMSQGSGSVQFSEAKLLANDSDPEGGVLTIQSILSATDGVIITRNEGIVSYTPAPGFSGPDTITYVVADPMGGTNSGQISVLVRPADAGTKNVVAISMVTGGVKIEFAGIPGRVMIIQSSATPTGPWSLTHGPAQVESNGLLQYIDTSPLAETKYYRTLELLP